MDLTTLDGLLATGCAQPTTRGLRVTVDPEWIVANESRVSYTTMVRLAECARELHWHADVAPSTDSALDSTLKSCSAEFMAPVDSGATIDLVYRVTATERGSYELRIDIRDHATGFLHAVVTMICVVFEKRRGIARGRRSIPCVEAVASLDEAQDLPAGVA